MKLLIAACLFAAVLVSCTKAPEKTDSAKQQAEPPKPASVSASGAPLEFGFADATGKRIRAIGHQEQPAALTRAVCLGTELLTIRFTGQKQATEANTNRDSAQNFDASGGFYYEIANGAASEDMDCLLTDERFFAGKNLVRTESISDKPEKKTVERIAQAKQRRVKEARAFERIAPDREFYLVLFERVGDSALFSIVMATPSRLVFLDFPGNYKNEDSVWRVDDGGEWDPLSLTIGLVVDSGQGIGFMYSWAGPEGISIAFVQETGDIFRRVKEAYRYMSPA